MNRRFLDRRLMWVGERLRLRLGRLGAPEATGRSQRAWLGLAGVIGVVAGLGGVLFYDGLHLATRLLLTDVGGYTPAGTLGEGGRQVASGFSRPWAVPLVVAGGALAAGVLVFCVAPEAEGHGTDAAIAAVHTDPTGIRPRAVAVKLVASMLTIGSGGSGGREGPTAQISAGFGSALARRLRLTAGDARICVAAGMASGIAAIFSAPLGGALLGAELLFRDDIAVEALIPSLVSSVVAFAVFAGITGHSDPIFGYHSGYQLGSHWELILFVVVGVVCGAAGKLYAVSFYRAVDLFRRLAMPRALKPALAGLAVGGLGLVVPGVLGTGYGQIQTELDGQRLLAMSLLTVFAVPLAKIAATSLTVGSGGSGGIFGPGMVIGGTTGAAIWRVCELCGLHSHDQAAFVIVGMMACFGSVAHAPLAVMLMVAEMTGNLSLLPAAMIAIVCAVFVVGDATIYRSQPARRGDLAPPPPGGRKRTPLPCHAAPVTRPPRPS